MKIKKKSNADVVGKKDCESIVRFWEERLLGEKEKWVGCIFRSKWGLNLREREKGQESRGWVQWKGGRGCYLTHQQVSCIRTKVFPIIDYPFFIFIFPFNLISNTKAKGKPTLCNAFACLDYICVRKRKRKRKWKWSVIEWDFKSLSKQI